MSTCACHLAMGEHNTVDPTTDPELHTAAAHDAITAELVRLTLGAR